MWSRDASPGTTPPYAACRTTWLDKQGFRLRRRDRVVRGRMNLKHVCSSKTIRLAGAASFEQPMSQFGTVKPYSVRFVTAVARTSACGSSWADRASPLPDQAQAK